MTNIFSQVTCHIEAKESMARKLAMEKKESGSTSGSGSGIKPYRKEFLKPRGNWNKRERQVIKEGSTPSTANLRDYIGTSSPIGAEIEVRDCVDLETNFSDKGAKTLYMVKFPLDDGSVGVISVNQEIASKCYQESLRSMKGLYELTKQYEVHFVKLDP
ncbi:hypothetical protein JHK82_012523 [Glycine max]|nr:hypothetical protein JHK85_012877 [Glycine max]KAG5057544.1 hypothetical protein JHK86_012540 [Glycine max]KAG5154554.1 hypothetical protein JHK82_012523 [Glycine max]